MFDPRIHPAALNDQDLETLQIFGVRTVIAVSDSSAHPATPDGLFAHYDELMNVQVPRLERSGLKVFAALGVHPKVIPRRGLAQVLDALPGYFRGGKVVALGLLGMARGDAVEEEALIEQLNLAHRFKKAAIVTAPEIEKVTRRLLLALQKSKLSAARILVDGRVRKTVRAILELGFNAGLTLHPDHITVEQAVTLVRTLGPTRLVLDSAGGDGASDILSLGRAAHRLSKSGLSSKVVRRVTEENAATLFGV